MTEDTTPAGVCEACSVYGTCGLDAGHPGSHETSMPGNMAVRWFR